MYKIFDENQICKKYMRINEISINGIPAPIGFIASVVWLEEAHGPMDVGGGAIAVVRSSGDLSEGVDVEYGELDASRVSLLCPEFGSGFAGIF